MPNFENPNISNNLKESDGYLSQIANNADEKVGELADAVANGQLPRASDGRLKVLELGTGGGESVATLKKLIGDREDVDVFGADVSVGILWKIQNEQKIPSVASEAMKLPFKEGSLSAINASAVFHEVSSYGLFGGEREGVYGCEAVKHSLSEAQRSLAPNGMLAYRDVFCPNGMFEEKTVAYHGKSWEFFAKWFYPDFLKADTRAFSQDGQPSIEVREGGIMKISATKHLHRELQRHYLMLRDYLRTQLSRNIGLEVIGEEWIDREKGVKRHEFLASDALYRLIVPSGNQGYGRYEMTSEEYDRLFDRLIEMVLDGNSSLKAELLDWRKREGKEIYTYASVEEMLALACEAGILAKDGHILFPRCKDDIRVLSRDYYNRYLREVADNPEFDGKQTIRFFKVSPKETLEVLDSLGGDGIIGNSSEIRTKIETLI
jgi:SAM-dependent methyltransferase